MKLDEHANDALTLALIALTDVAESCNLQMREARIAVAYLRTSQHLLIQAARQLQLPLGMGKGTST